MFYGYLESLQLHGYLAPNPRRIGRPVSGRCTKVLGEPNKASGSAFQGRVETRNPTRPNFMWIHTSRSTFRWLTFLYENQLIHLNKPLKQRMPNIHTTPPFRHSSFGVRTWHIMMGRMLLCPNAKQLVANVADPEDFGPLVLSRELLLIGRLEATSTFFWHQVL